MQKITPFLWFDNKAEEAANFYTSVFKNSKILSVSRYGDAGPGPKGAVMVVSFQLEGQQFTALNGGPQSMSTGASSRPAGGKRASAGGSRTSSASPGRSCRPRSGSS